MKKKIISGMLAVMMVCSLAACGSSQTTEKVETGGDSANTLTVWCWDPAFNMYAMEEAGKVYQKDHPDFNLNVVETPWEDLQTKLTTAATSGDISTLPDIILMQDNAFQKNVISYPDTFVDLSDSGIDYSKFSQAKVAYSVIDDKNYGVPFDNGTVISCIRTDIIGEAGYTIDDFTDITWSKFLELGKDVLAKTGKPMLSTVAGETDLIVIMLQSAGSSLFDEEGNPTIMDNDALKEVLNVYSELVQSGVVIEVNDWDQYIGTLTNSTVAGTINGCWILASIQTATDQSGNWEITNMPKLEQAANATNYSNNGGSSWAITANTQNEALAKDFLASTFAGSVELYETILPSSGALATYLPAADSDVYAKPQEFFQGQSIYSMIVEYAGKVPSNNTGAYYYEARDAVATALSNVVGGADLEAELKNAQDTVLFQMGK